MIGVDLIGGIRRAYFEQRRPIKEIMRTLRVSRATVRKVIRGQATEFKYERGVQPAPKLGEWVEVLTEILEREAKLPRRERRSTQRLFEELRGRGYDGAHESGGILRAFCAAVIVQSGSYRAESILDYSLHLGAAFALRKVENSREERLGLEEPVLFGARDRVPG